MLLLLSALLWVVHETLKTPLSPQNVHLFQKNIMWTEGILLINYFCQEPWTNSSRGPLQWKVHELPEVKLSLVLPQCQSPVVTMFTYRYPPGTLLVEKFNKYSNLILIYLWPCLLLLHPYHEWVWHPQISQFLGLLGDLIKLFCCELQLAEGHWVWPHPLVKVPFQNIKSLVPKVIKIKFFT